MLRGRWDDCERGQRVEEADKHGRQLGQASEASLPFPCCLKCIAIYTVCSTVYTLFQAIEKKCNLDQNYHDHDLKLWCQGKVSTVFVKCIFWPFSKVMSHQIAWSSTVSLNWCNCCISHFSMYFVCVTNVFLTVPQIPLSCITFTCFHAPNTQWHKCPSSPCCFFTLSFQTQFRSFFGLSVLAAYSFGCSLSELSGPSSFCFLASLALHLCTVKYFYLIK